MSEIDPAVAGTCRACGQDLVHVPGENTYHPWNVEWPEGNHCPALLPLGGLGHLSRRVPDSEFIAGGAS
ncbi:hypothetical protein ACIRON_02995 [Nocardioides sp. NPDC101246]|uniref:hypothetical protein n=1 Tax=Nocardioides sp. NPDC101246 TaxID=3364336 RepID=UPI00382B7F22